MNPIQVVGTNGKHSFCSTLREIFETAGYTCNINISPSLRKFNERYYFSGKYISDEDLYDLLIEVEQINNNKSISFHEIITAAWILHASRKEAEVNIMEAGALFRLDSSNVFQKNICSVVMPIGIDHLDFLKKGTIDEIVFEKRGMREGDINPVDFAMTSDGKTAFITLGRARHVRCLKI